MNRIERLYRIHSLLSRKASVSLGDFLEVLDVSRATFKRDVEYMRDRLGAPIVWDKRSRGYRLSIPVPGAPAYELPGLWFNSGEIYALLTAYKVLSDIDPGILANHVGPLLDRLNGLIEAPGHAASQVARRVRLLTIGRRKVEPEFFALIAKALLERRQVRITAYNRDRGEILERVISPQRLVHYRDNWYLDAWCHLRESLRTFAVENLRGVVPNETKALDVSEPVLDSHFSSSYGIFSGVPSDIAVLRFTPERARWVTSEVWHPRQHGETLSDGSFRLSLPYGDPRELIMDILRYGSHVLVESPESLAAMVREEARKIALRYKK